MNERVDDKLQCLVGALEKIADFSKVCLGPGCPYCEAEGDLEPLHPATWEAKAAQAALENAGIRHSTNNSSGAIHPRREETMSTEKTINGAGESSPAPDGSADGVVRTDISILDEAAKVPNDGKPHLFRCPVCGEQALGRIDPDNDHTIAVCKCTPLEHRTWSQNDRGDSLTPRKETNG
jgi:hypothetical protein